MVNLDILPILKESKRKRVVPQTNCSYVNVSRMVEWKTLTPDNRLCLG